MGLIILKHVITKNPSATYLIVVPTDNLKEQWTQQLDSWGLGLNGRVEVVNTVIKHTWTVNVLVLDEAHRYNSPTFKEIFTKVRYGYVLGLTATFERLDGKHEIMAKYCPVIHTVSLQQALFNHWVSQFKEYLVVLNVDDIDTYKGYNREFIRNFEFFSFNFDIAMKCLGKEGFKFRMALRDKMYPRQTCTESQRKEGLKLITLHAVQFSKALQARKKFINNHPKKLEIAREIIEARPDSKIITFCNNVKMAESIGIGKVYTGKDSKKQARVSLEEFNAQSKGVINSAKKLIEGADISGLNVAIMLGIDSSETRAIQSRGRVIRWKEGKIAEIFNLVINDTVELKWFQNSHKNSPYITIDENGLREVLTGNKPKTYTKPLEEFTFRF